MRRHLYSAEHETFRSAFREFLDHEAVPFVDDWEAAGTLPREFWKAAGDAGYLGFEADPELGGLGIDDFRYNAVIQEEVAASGIANDGFSLHNDIVAPYLLEFTTAEQRQRWLPGFTAGETITAIAMTEPQAGSDLAAVATSGRRKGSSLVLNGSKTFITNGSIADLVIVLVRTGENDGRGMTLVAVEEGTPGMTRGQPLKKAGRRGQDTAEVFFDDCTVSVDNILGEPGDAFSLVKRNLARERLSIAVHAVASADTGLQLALEHTAMRSTFGRPLNRHQAVSHTLAEMHTAVQVARSHVDACVVELNEGRLTAEDAAGAKFWATDLEGAILDQALQLFGGYGFMDEYPISRRWRDARVQRIYGGANEIMKDIVGRGLTR